MHTRTHNACVRMRVLNNFNDTASMHSGLLQMLNTFLLVLFKRLFQAFISNFTQALQLETRYTDITVQLLSPGFVKTKFVAFSPLVLKLPQVLVPNVETFASHAADTLGYSNHTTGYWNHGLHVRVSVYLNVNNYIRTFLFKTINNYDV